MLFLSKCFTELKAPDSLQPLMSTLQCAMFQRRRYELTNMSIAWDVQGLENRFQHVTTGVVGPLRHVVIMVVFPV